MLQLLAHASGAVHHTMSISSMPLTCAASAAARCTSRSAATEGSGPSDTCTPAAVLGGRLPAANASCRYKTIEA